MNNTYFPILWSIAKNTYREIIRDRLLYGILLMALLVSASSFFLSSISLEQNVRVLQNVGFAAIHAFTLFIAIFVTTNSISKDFERRTLYLLFPKPITRTQYVVGKYLGMCLLVVTTLALLGGLFSLGAYFVSSTLPISTLIVLSYSFLEVSLLTGLALLFASFTAPLNASLYTLALFIIGHSLTSLKEFMLRQENPLLTLVANASYYLLPNLEKFDIRRSVLYDLAIPSTHVLMGILYWAVYLTVVLYLTVTVMKKREI